MKKTLLAIGAVLAMSGATATAPHALWGNLIDGTHPAGIGGAGDQSTQVAVDAQGNAYWYGTYGSTDDYPEITYAGEKLYDGALYDHNAGTSQNNNFTVLKTDADGNKLWCVYSNSGDFASNAGFAAVTSDGGVVVVSKVRHTDNMTDKNIMLYDASGNPYEVEWTCVGKRFYRLFVTKISAAGEIEWNRVVDFSTEPGPSAAGNYAEFWSDVFNVPGGTVDDNDNIYVALNYRNPMTVEKADNTPVTFTPKNTASWTGDSQTVTGDFLLLALDKDGYYRNSLQLEGSCGASYCQKLVWNDGRLFAQGYIVGNGSSLKVGSHDLVPSDVTSPLLLSTDADLDVKWAKCFKGEKVQNRSGFQNVGITAVNGALFVCGQYNIKFSDPDNADNFVTSTQGTTREGFVLKLDAATGSWLAARNSRDDEWANPSSLAKTGLTGYFQVLANPAVKDRVYVFGYVMNQNVGVFLRQYNADTLEGNPEGEYNIVTGGGVPSCQTAVYDTKNNVVYATARGNNSFKLLGSEEATAKPNSWAVLAAKFAMPSDMTAGVESVDADMSVDAPVEYYNLQGMRETNPGRGLYIRRQGNRSEKVVL